MSNADRRVYSCKLSLVLLSILSIGVLMLAARVANATFVAGPKPITGLASQKNLSESTGTDQRAAGLPADHDPVSGRYIVVLNGSVDHPGLVAAAQANNVTGSLGFVYRSALKGYSIAGLSRAEAQVLRNDSQVKFVVPDHKVEAFAQTVPTGIARSFALENKTIDIDETDDVRVNADVAVIDTGIDYTHPDLNVVSRVICGPQDETISEYSGCVANRGVDESGHGTHVAGTIGALDNNFGVVGVAPGTRLWAVKVLGKNSDGIDSGFDSWVIAGIDWVTRHSDEIEVANMSFGGEEQSPAVEAAIDASLDAGVVYTVAAGNEETNAESQHPANDPDVITVSALSDKDGKAGGVGKTSCGWGADDTLAKFSNWGSRADIAAPGTCIYSTWKENNYAMDSGTSMASPHVAGAAAILASQSNPNSRTDVEKIRDTLVLGGSLDWQDTSNDGRAEPLLYLGEKALTEIEVATGGYSSPDGESATLYGSVNPRGQAFEYYFEYGSSTEYGQKAGLNPGKIGSGTGYQVVNRQIKGLEPEHLYHYRLVVKTGSASYFGNDHTFRPSLWTTPTLVNMPTHTGGDWMTDVSCGAVNSCMAVGHYFDGDNRLSSYELSGGQWTFRDVPEPSGPNVEGFSEIDGISCTSTSACTAVGKVQIAGGVVVPLAERWNGSSWSLQAIPAPSNSPYARLLDVSCASAAECIAVGYYKNTSDVWVNFSAQWKGGSWSLLTTPNIEGTTESEVTGISCTSATFCMAVGRSEGPRVPLTMVWNGTSWTLKKGARSSGWLSSVSCTSSAFCMAVTAYPNAESWNGESWSVQNWVAPSGGGGWLNSISCSTATYCRAVGEAYKESRRSSFAETWSGGTWTAQVGVRKAEASSIAVDVSCILSFGCAAVGGERGGPGKDSLIESYRGTSTTPASNITAGTVTLNGVVNPEGIASTYRFEYGTTTSYGTSVPISEASAGSGGEPVDVSQSLTELPAETTFHYRLVMTNQNGVQYGGDRVFRTAAYPPVQTAMYGHYGTADGLFNRPKGVAVDKEGNFWVADDFNDRIQKFNSKGELLMKFGAPGQGNGQFSGPMDIAFTSDGKLWVTDSGNARVQQFDSTGKYLDQFGSGQLVYPKGIAIGPNGHIWVTDYLYDRVKEFTASGEFIRAVGDTQHGGNGETSFSYPDGVAVGGDGRVWVADRHHDKVQILSSAGQYLGQLGGAGRGLGEFEEPSAIEVKPSGDILVTDRTLGRVQQFDPSGNYVVKFGRGDGVVSEQEGLAVASQGVVYVVQGNAHGVEKWEAPSPPEVITGAATDVSGRGAMLTGTVDPRGLPTDYHFEYGKTTAYGTKVPVPNQSVGSGTAGVTVSQAISGLAPTTTYHYRVVATNSEGTTVSVDRAFETQSLLTVLCKTTGKPCREADRYPAGTAIEAKLKSGTESVISNPIAPIKCSFSTLAGATTDSGGSSKPVGLQLTSGSFSCSNSWTVKVEATPWNGSLGPGEGAADGVLHLANYKLKAERFGMKCEYSGEVDFEFKGATEPELVAAEEPLARTGGSSVCGSSGNWSASYVVAAPSPLWIGEPPALGSTVICKTSEEPCSEANRYGSGTSLGVALKAGTKTTFANLIYTTECSSSSLTGQLSGSGGSNQTVPFEVTGAGATGCSNSATVTPEGFPWHGTIARADGLGNGTLHLNDAKLKLLRFGITCVFGGELDATVKGNSEITIKEAKLKKLSGSGACGEEGVPTGSWSGTYAFNAPSPLYIAWP